MKCGYCGFEFIEEEGIRGCGTCGRPERCRQVRCPRCFYENPPESGLVKKLKNMVQYDKN